MRVISLLPGATEIVAALAAGDSEVILVGVTHECDYPASVHSLPRVTASAVDARAASGAIDAAVHALASTGSAVFALDEAMIARLRPDVLVTQALCDVCAVSETDVRALASRLRSPGATSPEVVTLSGTTLAGIFDDVRAVAEHLGCAPQGELLLENLRARLRIVHERLKAHRAPRPRIAVIEWADPLYAAGHWVPELVHRAGGTDVLASPGAHSHPIDLHTLIEADPEIICIAPCGFDCGRAADEADRLRSLPAWQPLRDREVWALDANALTSRAGPRLVEAVEVLAAIGNPDLFPKLSPDRARRIA